MCRVYFLFSRLYTYIFFVIGFFSLLNKTTGLQKEEREASSYFRKQIAQIRIMISNPMYRQEEKEKRKGLFLFPSIG